MDFLTGNEGEVACAALLEVLGAQVWQARDAAAQRMGVDLWVTPPDGETYGVQCKYDAKSAETGNVFVETATESADGAMRPSGLATCEARVVMLVLPGRGVASVDGRALCALAAATGRARQSYWNEEGGRRWRALGYILRVTDILAARTVCTAWFPEGGRR